MSLVSSRVLGEYQALIEHGGPNPHCGHSLWLPLSSSFILAHKLANSDLEMSQNLSKAQS